MAEDERNWGIFDTWQGRWCPRQRSSYDDALQAAYEYNKREAIGSNRYQARRNEPRARMRASQDEQK